MRTQIYTMQTVAEAEAVAALGVDHVGVTPAQHGLPGEIGWEVAADICRELAAAEVTSVALTVDTDLNAIIAMVQTVAPDILHLCGPPGLVDPVAVTRLRRDLPQVAVMQAIAVTGPEAWAAAQEYQSVADYLILDSVTPDVVGIGAAGVTHDWELSAAIVDAVDVPVILAGGLSPENVAAAAAAVHPWGVDSLTHTNRPLPGGGFRKDLDAVARFVAAAESAS